MCSAASGVILDSLRGSTAVTSRRVRVSIWNLSGSLSSGFASTKMRAPPTPADDEEDDEEAVAGTNSASTVRNTDVCVIATWTHMPPASSRSPMPLPGRSVRQRSYSLPPGTM